MLYFGQDRRLSLIFMVGRKKKQVQLHRMFFFSNFEDPSTLLGHRFIEPDRSGLDLSGSEPLIALK